MKCPECDGTGKVVHPMMSMNGDEYIGEWEQHECEMCGGTGEVERRNTMKCKHCNGFGWYYNDITKTKKIKCEYCNGTGEIQQTNEKWFCNLPTGKKAEVIFDIVEFCLSYETYPDKNKYKDLMGNVEDIKKWLKQPHHESVTNCNE